ncbi:zinc metalloprotease [Mesobacillus campisalis]|uniref:Zinc metalloprotease n=1 Tax=Mesobacillus campisalis TaxID=1408103 RepID=A0A0M2SV02_9BACI|nr:site-2 protease family protein [Mesobacillus campisalis]KKK37993.1 zinc metalloprotease [Mesobacillus campisalis]
MWFSLEQLPYIAVTLIIAFTLHELAHAYVAYKFGDPTAARQGRLTLNPLKHLDPIGTILIFIAGFGWARPVPVNRFFFKNPRLAGVLVSVAGPLSNFLLVVLAYFFVYGMGAAGLGEAMPEFIFEFLNMFIRLNMVLFVFNLLPLPPLDGYRIIEDLAPANIRAKMTQYENYGSIIFLILVITPLYQYTIGPVMHTVIPFLINTLNTFFQLLLR